MKKDKALYIEDEKGQKLFYSFKPALLFSNFSPLLVLFTDEDNTTLHDFEYKMWNILIPCIGSSDEEKKSCQNLLQKLTKEMVDDLECEEHIYLYENSPKNKNVQDAIMRFKNTCKENKIELHIDNSPKVYNTQRRNLEKVLDMFERVSP
ncbi:hypothetical protein JHD48_01885 [Sulfurimonas sp. SAG-AH-194-I05]|nr:hypothetical protein [Sulfurimonas sp. SAG-AH-194-I05]MDF1874479.1 hypothetical protein [Sulfurimonas sp. SAG-AH-194-I05]